MLSYKDFIVYFGCQLNASDFQSFLVEIFNDLTSYDITESDYIVSEVMGIELGFTNKSAIYDDDDRVIFEKGDPIFSHFTAYPKSSAQFTKWPFNISFDDRRDNVFQKAGIPAQTNEGYADFLKRNFLVDSYKIDDVIFTVDYNPDSNTINFMQMRGNSLMEHLTLK
ncbi:MAG TPA: hypothetical protein VIH61_01890 [Waddliaceae bacterium]